MDEYPEGSLDNSIPFLLTFGTRTTTEESDSPAATLSHALKDEAILIRSELEPLDSDQARAVLRYIKDRDASNLPCSARDSVPRRYRFRVRSAERSILLPPRRARLPEGYEPPSPTQPLVLHSPYSPLSPISTLYPDGIIDPNWLRKHQYLIPSVLLCFYSLVADPTLSTLCDNQIKTDINNIRALLSQSGYKTRLAVVLLSEHGSSSSHASDGVQERLEIIRRGCGLDSKALFLVPAGGSQEELERVAENMLTTLYAVAIDYYRDLGRHSRKKRSRGVAPQPTVPPTSGTSQTLSLAGWNVRYDFKTAVFAEYRLEMDVALRSYELAYENLLSSELMELIPSWSPRWNEGRLLADTLAVRCLRCLLWNGQHSAAARRWQYHRERLADLVDRRARGTNNYSWEAWEARWAVVMADLIDRAGIAELAPSSQRLYLPPEKSAMGERLQPWELLHHKGYWYRLAATHVQARRAFAHAIPDDHRRSPGDSPATLVAKSAFAYDTYMCPEPYEEYPLRRPGVNHGRIIIDLLTRARDEFLKRNQVRLAAEVSLDCARELAMTEEWQKAVDLLRPLWKDLPFRSEGWTAIAESLTWGLRAAAAQIDDAELVILADWALLSRDFTKRPNWHYDISKALDDVDVSSKPSVSVRDGQFQSFISAAFLFEGEEGRAGQSVRSQLSITSNAQPESAPVVLGSVYLSFHGCLDGIILRHQKSEQPASARGKSIISTVALTRQADGGANTEKSAEDGSGLTLLGSADLTLHPGQSLVFNMEVPLREPGETRADTVTLHVGYDDFDLRQTITLQERGGKSLWHISPSRTKILPRPNPLAVRVLPRPPKMEIRRPVWKEQYYTDEPIDLEFGIENGEDIEALAKLDVVLFGEKPPSFTLSVPGHEDQISSNVRSEEARISAAPIGTIASAQSLPVRLRLPPIDRPSGYDLTLKVTYFLPTNPGTPISQNAVFQLNVVNPFEANYELLPRLHPEQWPSLFDPGNVVIPPAGDDAESQPPPQGISQAWCLVTRYASFAAEPLRVTDVDIVIHPSPAAQYSLTRRTGLPSSGVGRLVPPQTIQEAAFDLVAKKATIDDRGHAPLDVSLVIRWARPGDAKAAGEEGAEPPAPEKINTTTLPIPRFNVFGTEPRVLASVSHHRRRRSGRSKEGEEEEDQEYVGAPFVTLTITIENASTHFLTFGLSMEPSEMFAFSGPKQTTLSLLPVSRRSVRYRLLAVGDEAEGSASGIGQGGKKEEEEDEKKKDGREKQEEEAAGVWVRPALVVRDKYFQKVLRVIPASEGVRAGKEGFEVWLPRLG
ncbi:hypothetical protein VTJ83DRAFT_5484 [Remersonia thermophila]|uniref:Trafficking protein particle complex subunit 11 domain-containing protein n=1 Tax=Remersonia thermophila TaxID=72144 RepID=A0ABR4D962_9PEZI